MELKVKYIQEVEVVVPKGRCTQEDVVQVLKDNGSQIIEKNNSMTGCTGQTPLKLTLGSFQFNFLPGVKGVTKGVIILPVIKVDGRVQILLLTLQVTATKEDVANVVNSNVISLFG